MRQNFAEQGATYHWNMNAAFLMQLDQRRNDKAEAAIEQDVYRWYACNLEILTSISGIIDKAELTAGKDLLDAVMQKLKEPVDARLTEQAKASALRNRKLEAVTKLHEVDILIMGYLFQYKLVYVIPEKRSLEDQIEDDLEE